MKDEKSTTFERGGAIYTRSVSKSFRLLCHVLGAVLVVLGVLLALAFPPVGIVLVILGLLMFFKLSKREEIKFVSFARPTLAGCRTFGSWNEQVHRGAAQSDRFERALHDGIAIIGYNAKTGVATISGSTGNKYTTTLDYCSCEDFSKRSKPCKHIYLLASQMGFSGDDFYN